jgi:hypothetical protein
MGSLRSLRSDCRKTNKEQNRNVPKKTIYGDDVLTTYVSRSDIEAAKKMMEGLVKLRKAEDWNWKDDVMGRPLKKKG